MFCVCFVENENCIFEGRVSYVLNAEEFFWLMVFTVCFSVIASKGTGNILTAENPATSS